MDQDKLAAQAFTNFAALVVIALADVLALALAWGNWPAALTAVAVGFGLAGMAWPTAEQVNALLDKLNG